MTGKLAQERRGHSQRSDIHGPDSRGPDSHLLYSWWLTVVTPAVRLCFGWRHAGRRLRLKIVLSALAVLSFGTGVTLAATGIAQPGDAATMPAATVQAAAAYRAQAAAWIAQQVGPNVNVSCDPEMCAELRNSGFPVARLSVLPPSADGPLGSDMVVATPVIQSQFGARLATAYAPLVIASFGSGAARVDIRVVAPRGADALQAQLATERTHLISAGKQLLHNENIQVSPAARTALLTGQVDPRLLVTLSALAAEMPLRLVTFDAASPGATTAVPLRGAEIGTVSAAGLSAVLAFWHAQQAPYLPAVAARSTSGRPLVTVRFDAQGLKDVGAP
jgi:hypothetical protein